MASSLRLIAVTLLLLSLMNAAFTTGLEEDELESMLNVLRDSGYNLFGNAITTSDLFYEVLSGKTFTFFAPTDSSLFALDMTNSAAEYTAYLRCHVIPVRISVAELRRFASGYSFPTLLKDNRVTLLIQRRSSTTASDEVVSVGGVRVTFPGLFYSRNLAIHGLAGTINCRSHPELPPANDLHDNHSHSPPPVHTNLTQNFRSHSLGANLSGDPNIISPVTQSQSQPINSSDNHNFESPIVRQSKSPAPSPNSGESNDHNMKLPAAEAPELGGYFESPVDLSPEVSPAYEEWPRVPEFGRFDSGTVPPLSPEFSENDDPIAFPPSDFGDIEDHGSDIKATESELASLSDNDLMILHEEEEKSEVADDVPVISREDQDRMTKKEPPDEIARDCPRTVGFSQISFLPGSTNFFCTGE